MVLRRMRIGSVLRRFAAVVALAAVVLGCSSNSTAPAPPFGAVHLDSGRFGAVVVDPQGEALLPFVSRDESGNATRITGALWTDVHGGYVAVYLDDQGLPSKTVVGDYVLLFANWDTAQGTVDIAKIYVPTGYVEVLRAVRANLGSNSPLLQTSDWLPRGRGALRSSSLGLETFCFPNCGSPVKNLKQGIQYGEAVMLAGACIMAEPATLFALALPCAGAVAKLATLAGEEVGADESWLDQFQNFERVVALGHLAQCVNGSEEACVLLLAGVAGQIADQADKSLQDAGPDLLVAGGYLSDPTFTGGVAQQGGGPPVCPGIYECSPGALMPCYPDGVKQCSPSCAWGPCASPDSFGPGTGPSSDAGGGDDGSADATGPSSATQICTATTGPTTCCSGMQCTTVPGTSTSNSVTFTVPAGTSLDQVAQMICASALAASSGTGDSCNCATQNVSANSYTIVLTCTRKGVSGCSDSMDTETCTAVVQ